VGAGCCSIRLAALYVLFIHSLSISYAQGSTTTTLRNTKYSVRRRRFQYHPHYDGRSDANFWGYFFAPFWRLFVDDIRQPWPPLLQLSPVACRLQSATSKRRSRHSSPPPTAYRLYTTSAVYHSTSGRHVTGSDVMRATRMRRRAETRNNTTATNQSN